MDELKEIIKFLNEEYKIKYVYFYEKIGVSRSKFSFWLNGERDSLSDEQEKIIKNLVNSLIQFLPVNKIS